MPELIKNAVSQTLHPTRRRPHPRHQQLPPECVPLLSFLTIEFLPLLLLYRCCFLLNFGPHMRETHELLVSHLLFLLNNPNSTCRASSSSSRRPLNSSTFRCTSNSSRRRIRYSAYLSAAVGLRADLTRSTYTVFRSASSCRHCSSNSFFRSYASRRRAASARLRSAYSLFWRSSYCCFSLALASFHPTMRPFISACSRSCRLRCTSRYSRS